MAVDVNAYDLTTDEGRTAYATAVAEEINNAANARVDEATKAVNKHAAVTKAGIPTGTKVGDAFLAQYDGELTDEAIRTAAQEWGLWDPASANAQAVEHAANRDKLEGGSNPGQLETPSEEPGVQGLKKFRERRAQGERREDAAQSVVGVLMEAAIAGDKRAIHNPDEWAKNARPARV